MPPPKRPRTVFHVATAEDWRRAQKSGTYAGSALCRRDGFIHMSTAAQLPGTLARFFAGRGDLVLLAVETEALAPALHWEDAPGVGTFPHYYGTLPVAQLRNLGAIVLAADGHHIRPTVASEQEAPA